MRAGRLAGSRRARGRETGAWLHVHANLLGHAAYGGSQKRRKASAWANVRNRLVMVLGLLALGLALQLG